MKDNRPVRDDWVRTLGMLTLWTLGFCLLAGGLAWYGSMWTP